MTAKAEIPMALRAAYLALHRQSEARFAQHGVTADQFVLLATLARGHALTQRELARRMPSDPSPHFSLRGRILPGQFERASGGGFGGRREGIAAGLQGSGGVEWSRFHPEVQAGTVRERRRRSRAEDEFPWRPADALATKEPAGERRRAAPPPPTWVAQRARRRGSPARARRALDTDSRWPARSRRAARSREPTRRSSAA